MRCQIIHSGILWSFIFLIVLIIPILCLALPLKYQTNASGFVYGLVVSIFVILWFYVALQITSTCYMTYKRNCLSSMCIEFFKQKPDHLKVWADYGLLLGLKRDKHVIWGDPDLDLNLYKDQRGEVIQWAKTQMKAPLYYDEKEDTIFHRRNPFKIDLEPGVERDSPFGHVKSTLPLKGHPIPVPEDVHGRLINLYQDYWVKRPFAKDYEPETTEKWRRRQAKLYKYLHLRF